MGWAAGATRGAPAASQRRPRRWRRISRSAMSPGADPAVADHTTGRGSNATFPPAARHLSPVRPTTSGASRWRDGSMGRISTSSRASRDRKLRWPATIAVAVALTASRFPAVAFAATPTTTTLDVPSATQYGPVAVTAHLPPVRGTRDGFTPAVMFLVDGAGGLPALIHAAGDATTELTLPVGSHSIVASFGGFWSWDASASDPHELGVGISTQTSLSSSRNPA